MPALMSHLPDYRSLESATARDLCWLLSPRFDLPMPESAYSAFQPEMGILTAQWLTDIDRAQQQLGREGKLGQYFEDLVAYYLRHRVVCGHSLQRNVALRRPAAVGSGVNTIGELDFLYRHQQQWQHLEVAVKFYLGVDIAGQRMWLGPNSKDRLDKKRLRMLSHQLPLAQLFTEFNPIRSSYWLKGILFEPWHESAAADRPFNWLYQKQVDSYFERQSGSWALLPKRGWLGTPAEGAVEMDTRYLRSELKSHFQQAAYGVMVTKRGASEERRCFIVTDTWPENVTV